MGCKLRRRLTIGRVNIFRGCICKMAAQDIDPAGFIDPAVEDCYNNDYHRVYTGEIIRVLTR